MKTFALLVEPYITGHHAKDQTATLLRVPIIRRGIDVEPNALHVGQIAAQLLDHFMTLALGAEARTFHDLKFSKLGPLLQDHVKIGIEAASGDDDRFAADFV